MSQSTLNDQIDQLKSISYKQQLQIDQLKKINEGLAKENTELGNVVKEQAGQLKLTNISASLEAYRLTAELQMVRDEDAKVAAEHQAQIAELVSKIKALEAENELLQCQYDGGYNDELFLLTLEIEELKRALKRALEGNIDVAPSSLVQTHQGAEPESDNHCLQRTGGMKPALVRGVRLHLKTAKETGNHEALCAYLTEKSQWVVLTVFEDIFTELKLPIPNKGAKRTIKKDYLVLLK